jgi:hypothetical protein
VRVAADIYSPVIDGRDEGAVRYGRNIRNGAGRPSRKTGRVKCSSYRVVCGLRRGIAAATARRTPFTVSALLNTRATSGSSSTATAPGGIRVANRLGFDLV